MISLSTVYITPWHKSQLLNGLVWRSLALFVCLSVWLAVCLCGIFSYLYDFISHEFYINKSQLACTQVEATEREAKQLTRSIPAAISAPFAQFYINNIYLAHLAVYGQQGGVPLHFPALLTCHCCRHSGLFLKASPLRTFIVITISCKRYFAMLLHNFRPINIKSCQSDCRYTHLHTHTHWYTHVHVTMAAFRLTMGFHSTMRTTK